MERTKYQLSKGLDPIKEVSQLDSNRKRKGEKHPSNIGHMSKWLDGDEEKLEECAIEDLSRSLSSSMIKVSFLALQS